MRSGLGARRRSLVCALVVLGLLTGAASSSATHVRTRPAAHAATAVRGNPFNGRAMWIWELGASNQGSVSQIIGRARQNGISTVMIKSSDGTSMWSQFNSETVAELHHAHINVCAWQYVYGSLPGTEAQLGAAAVRAGADCLVIDAESEYEGKYVSAQSYIRELRKLVGYSFPVALAGFPYVDYHPSFPYSVFLGPGGAQYNAPQMYWRDIGVSPDAVYSHTYEWGRIYQRPIFPLGQLYSSPPLGQVFRFRQLARAYRATGVSWWDWQAAGTGEFWAMSKPVGGLAGYRPETAYGTLGEHTQSDVVVWAQEHLIGCGERTGIDGDFGPGTRASVKAFQSAHHLSADGVIGQSTWGALIRCRIARISWVVRRGNLVASGASGGQEPVPKSASLPAKRYEIPRSLGAGRPS